MYLFRRNRIDDTFGAVRFHREFFFFGKGYWKCEMPFADADEPIIVHVGAGLRGIQDRHRIFWNELAEKYQGLRVPISNEIIVDPPYPLGRWYEGDLGWGDFETDFIFVPNEPGDDAEWCISYRFIPWGHFLTIYFEGWKLSYCRYDD